MERVKQGMQHHQGSAAWANLLKAAPKLPSMASLRGAGSVGRLSPKTSVSGPVGGGQGWDATMHALEAAPSKGKK